MIDLVDKIGTAQMEQEVEKRIMKIAREHDQRMKEKTGIHSSMQEYVARKGMIAGGIALLIIAIIIFFFSSYINNIQSNNMQQYNSFTGQLSQSLSQQNAQICGRAPAYQSLGSAGILLSIVMSIIGIALIIIGAIKSKKASLVH